MAVSSCPRVFPSFFECRSDPEFSGAPKTSGGWQRKPSQSRFFGSRLNSPASAQGAILRFPPNFVRQLSTKARRNCSNIGVAQIVAASWSNNSNPSSPPPAAASSSAAAAAAAATEPIAPIGDDVALLGKEVDLKANEKMGVCVGERFGRGIVTDAITTPVVNTSAYFFKKTSELIDFKEKRKASFEYGRYGNPTTVVLEEKIRHVFVFLFVYCALEGAESTMITSSGMNISTVMLMALVPAGGHLVTTTDCYRKTRIFIENFLPKMGIK
ncbi:cystathionine gamma-synthase 1, partial [Quercus suber]